MIIRNAQAADADPIFTLVEKFATSFPPRKAAFEASLAELLIGPSALLNVAEIDGSIIGYCLAFDHFTFYVNGRVTWVEEIMVEEEHRKSGIGQALMAEVEEWAKKRDSKLVALATRRAAPFYKALAYEESAIYFRKLITDY